MMASAATMGKTMPMPRRFIRWSMNGWPAVPSAFAVGCRKNPPMIAPPNHIIADPTWTMRKKISHPSTTSGGCDGRPAADDDRGHCEQREPDVRYQRRRIIKLPHGKGDIARHPGDPKCHRPLRNAGVGSQERNGSHQHGEDPEDDRDSPRHRLDAEYQRGADAEDPCDD